MDAFEVIGRYVLKGGEKVNKTVKNIGDNASKSFGGIENLGDRINTLGDTVSRTGDKMTKWVTGPLAAASAGVVALSKKASDATRDIQKYSDLTGETSEEFQKQAFAANTVGIEMDKYGDILKDVNDRVGDFLSTGGGPMADFFENIAPKVGVTADQFRGLSGKDALQLYVSTLERAGVNSQQMTFYMEAMAGDAAALIPLFAANGKELQRLGDQAKRSGLILSSELIESSKDGREAMAILGAQFEAMAVKLGTSLLPVMEALVPLVSNVIAPALSNLATIIEVLTSLISALPEPLQTLIGTVALLALGLGPIVSIGGRLIKVLGLVFNVMRVGRVVALGLSLAMSPIALVVGAVVAAVYLGIKAFQNWDRIVEITKNVLTNFATVIGGIFNGMYQEISSWVSDVWNRMVNGFRDIVSNVVGAVRSIPSQIMAALKSAGSSILSWASGIASRVKSMFTGIFSDVEESTGRAQQMASSYSNAASSVERRSGSAGAPSQATTRGNSVASSGNTYVDMRNSVFRDDADLTDRIRRNGGKMLGGMA